MALALLLAVVTDGVEEGAVEGAVGFVAGGELARDAADAEGLMRCCPGAQDGPDAEARELVECVVGVDGVGAAGERQRGRG